MDGANSWTGIIVQALILLGLVAGFLKRRQERRWDVQDREQRMKREEDDRRRVAGEIKAALEERASALALAATLGTQEMVRRMNENKELLNKNTDLTREAAVKADQAYHEANNVNNKLAALSREKNEQIDRIEDHTEETKETVGEIDRKIDGREEFGKWKESEDEPVKEEMGKWKEIDRKLDDRDAET